MVRRLFCALLALLLSATAFAERAEIKVKGRTEFVFDTEKRLIAHSGTQNESALAEALAVSDAFESLVRLHVIAESDSEIAQARKLKVRDAVLETANGLLRDAQNPEAALQTGLPELERAANEKLASLGCEETASVSLRRELFPTREYETFRLPAGVYRTLRVSIGQAGGHNWWCVVFPALCLPAAQEDVAEACRAAGLTDQEISVLTEDTGEVELEFRTLEWLGKLKKMLWDA